MKAMMLREFGRPNQLKLEDIETPKPGSKEVVVRLKAAALNRRDLLVIHGRYPGTKMPAILGSDLLYKHDMKKICFFMFY
ncbi:alcohol dehydrogenase catalytic domain-containing protein [Paenibacillus sp. NPDC055715]